MLRSLCLLLIAASPAAAAQTRSSAHYSITDDYGAYAADGLADDWQVQYFECLRTGSRSRDIP